MSNDQYEIGTLEDADRFAATRVANQAGLTSENEGYGNLWTADDNDLARVVAIVRSDAVKECLEVVRSFRLRMDASNENIVVGIKQHFGVD